MPITWSIRTSLACIAAVTAFWAGGNSHDLSAQAPQKTSTVAQLIAKVLAARSTSGFRIRAKLTRMSGASSVKVTRQLLTRGRRDGDATSVAYQVIWPADAAGRAVVVKDAGDHRSTGFIYDGHSAVPLTKAALAAPLFDSDLLIEDVLEGFWYWPSRAIAGNEVIDKRPCERIEFRPGPETQTTYTKAVACVSVELAVVLRLDLYGSAGAPLKQITTDRLVRRDDHWLAGSVTVVPRDHEHRTTLEGSEYEGNLQIPESEFSVAAIANFGKTPGRL